MRFYPEELSDPIIDCLFDLGKAVKELANQLKRLLQTRRIFLGGHVQSYPKDARMPVALGLA
jgi:hypothetical protein